jgi:hypothetical protein
VCIKVANAFGEKGRTANKDVPKSVNLEVLPRTQTEQRFSSGASER